MAANNGTGLHPQQPNLKFTKLDVLNNNQELPYESWIVRAKQEALARKKPSIRTCLGLGSGITHRQKKAAKK